MHLDHLDRHGNLVPRLCESNVNACVVLGVAGPDPCRVQRVSRIAADRGAIDTLLLRASTSSA
jgi:hypothetical protein